MPLGRRCGLSGVLAIKIKNIFSEAWIEVFFSVFEIANPVKMKVKKYGLKEEIILIFSPGTLFNQMKVSLRLKSPFQGRPGHKGSIKTILQL